MKWERERKQDKENKKERESPEVHASSTWYTLYRVSSQNAICLSFR